MKLKAKNPGNLLAGWTQVGNLHLEKWETRKTGGTWPFHLWLSSQLLFGHWLKMRSPWSAVQRTEVPCSAVVDDPAEGTSEEQLTLLGVTKDRHTRRRVSFQLWIFQFVVLLLNYWLLSCLHARLISWLVRWLIIRLVDWFLNWLVSCLVG